MGGFAAAMSTDEGVAGVILLDAWNAGVTATQMRAQGAEGRAAMIASFDDLGEALDGATAESMTDEVVASTAWDLTARAHALAAQPLLIVYATAGIAEDNRALATAVEAQAGARVETVAFETDHAFADHRIALSVAVVDWLQRLD